MMRYHLTLTLFFGLRILSFRCFSFDSNAILRAGFKLMTSSRGVSWPDKPEFRHLVRDFYDCKHYNKVVEFPDYYQSNFHAYPNCNLNPTAAIEAKAASEAVFVHHFPKKSAVDSASTIRSAFTRKTLEVSDVSENSELSVVDAGCGVGISTSFLKSSLPTSFILGLDLSPFYLNEVDDSVESGRTFFMHRNIEDTNILQDSVDIVSVSYVFHEIPLSALIRILREAHRILRPGGTLAVLDMTADVKASSFLLQTIFDRTEPYLDDYVAFSSSRYEILSLVGFDVDESLVDDSLPKTTMFFCKKKKFKE